MLRISQVRVVEEKKKLRAIHDFAFGDGSTRGLKVIPEFGGGSVKADTDREKVPLEINTRTLGSRYLV